MCVGGGYVRRAPFFSSLLLPNPPANTDVEVGDEGMRALASAGCGEKLTSLHFSGEFFMLSCLFSPSGTGERRALLSVGGGCGRVGRMRIFDGLALYDCFTSINKQTKRSPECGGRRDNCAGFCRVRQKPDVAVPFM